MAKGDEEKEATETSGGKRKTIIIVAIPVLLLLAGAGWFFFLKPDKSGAPEALPEPKPGVVVKLDPITVNLAGAHFLKFGMALQPIASVAELDGSKALDLAIGEFSQMTMDELSTSEGRDKAKEDLIARIKLTYLPEGTDLAVVTDTTTDEKAGDSKSSSKDSKADDEAKIDIEKLSSAEAFKMADSLTVQPEVYDIYFTEFVMQ